VRAKTKNIVLIMTDTQTKDMVGCYGHPEFDTPNLDRLAAGGIRFDRAYTTCPLCTPARGAIFSGHHPQVNGAWGNDMSPHRSIPLMGEIFRRLGRRAAYTGKWHLDGCHYDGSGIPDGGFEPDWWYDRANLLAELAPEIRAAYNQSTTADDLRALDFGIEHVYGHRVTNRALDFLEQVEDDPFVLVVSYDEPHDPWLAPPEYWERFAPDDFPQRLNYGAPLQGKPLIQQLHAEGIRHDHGELAWPDLVAKRLKFFGCNSFIDREIGRVIDAVERLHGENTAIIYTADHGDQLGSHGLHDKGPMMYEETTNIPFICRVPGGPTGAVSLALVSHLDILPTMLDLVGAAGEWLPGMSLAPLFADPSGRVRDHVLINYNRSMRNNLDNGGFVPIRCIVDGRWKLAINLLDRDELYDLEADPYEMVNRIDDQNCSDARNAIHDRLLAEMAAMEDPMDNWLWGDRPWRRVRRPSYFAFQQMPVYRAGNDRPTGEGREDPHEREPYARSGPQGRADAP